ncbi:hypothetical protein B0H14DRAFT_2589690 [Mycena olivaceomarginata]|nr:hypothetical protein B0H14DRAFT_2589690 [Mycena olivaceomarginata]
MPGMLRKGQCKFMGKHGSRKPEKENKDLADGDGNMVSGGTDDASDFFGVAAVNVNTFLEVLSAVGNIKMFLARCHISSQEGKSQRCYGQCCGTGLDCKGLGEDWLSLPLSFFLPVQK